MTKNYSVECRKDRTDGSSVWILPVSRKRKTSEFSSKPFLGREKPSECRSKPFLGRENPRNFVPNHFSVEKNPRNSVPNQFWMRKTLEFCSELFSEEKNLGIPFWIIFGREKKNLEKTIFVSCFVKLLLFRGIPFCLVLGYRMDSSEILGITRNEHFIQQNNGNRVSGQNTSGRQDSPVMNTFGSLVSWTVHHQNVFW